jgi:hypothetical protein
MTASLSMKIQNAMRAVLPPGPSVEVESGPSTVVPIFVISVKAGSGLHRFLAGWAGEGWPADVERLVATAPEVGLDVRSSSRVGGRER